ncbi:hypothetical protein FB451DRAFT_428062 [Mycena latifolia]|nr:hypothetical protein FB451DRAFT_428062 [Mycena latifolia]
MLSFKNVFLAVLLSSSSLAVPIRREVPQEHSHEQFLRSVAASLQKNNPDGIVDPVFGLLGNAAAAGGLGKITDATCLQQATADQAFTNAKAAGDVQGQVDALIYRALERNSGSVGGVTAPCTSIKAVNPEIAAIQQHQDPASTDAAAVNKAIVLELAKQIASVGGDPLDALKSGTFAPGTIGDPTAKGKTCDTPNDAVGCIFTENLLVEDATAREVQAAVAGSTDTTVTDCAIATTSVVTSTTTQTFLVTVTAPAETSTSTPEATCPPAVTITVTASATPTASVGTGAAPPANTGSASSIGNFGSCSVPQIEFATGFDNHRETSFRPLDRTSYDHGSAQAISIITQFICDTLVNKCGADATAKATCAQAQAAANAAPPKTGVDADIFNKFFNITTQFAKVTAVDDQGRVIAGSTA